MTYDTKAQLVRHHQSYADHPDRFHCCQQLLCTAAVSPRCYWEVEWRGLVEVGVAYHSIQRKGSEADCSLGRTRGVMKPELLGSRLLRLAQQPDDLRPADHTLHLHLQHTGRVVFVFVDAPAGVLSLCRLSSSLLLHLHTFSAAFEQPLYLALRLLPHFSVCLRSALGDVTP